MPLYAGANAATNKGSLGATALPGYGAPVLTPGVPTIGPYRPPSGVAPFAGGGSVSTQGNTGPTGTIFPPSSTVGEAAGTGAALGTQTAAGSLPGYSGDLSSIGQNISAETAGQLPLDVITQIQQQAAERGVATGAPGSDNSNAAMLRALGLTSLNLTQQGQQNFQSILPSLPGYSLSQNPAFYTTPGENLQAGIAGANLTNNKQQFAAEQQANADALTQAQAGVKAGLGIAGNDAGGVTLPGAARPGTDAFGFPTGDLGFNPNGPTGPAPIAYGASNPQAPQPAGVPAGALNTGAMSQSDVDRILQSYAGGGSTNIDPETGLPISTGSGLDESFFNVDTSSGE